MATRPGSVSRDRPASRGHRLLEKSAFVIGEVCMYARLACGLPRYPEKCTHRYCAQRESSPPPLLLLFASSTAECTELLLPNNRFLIPPKTPLRSFPPLVSPRLSPFLSPPPSPVCYTPLFFPPSSHVRLVNFSRDLSFIIRCLFDSNRIFSWNFPSIDYTPIFIIPENRVFSWPEKYFEIFKVVKHEIIAYQYR